jgi:hypothetical protein
LDLYILDYVYSFYTLNYGGGKMRDTIIRQQRKHEAEQAISDLLERGFIIIKPLQEVTRDGKTFSRDSYGRRIFQQNNFTSCWMAVMRKVV